MEVAGESDAAVPLVAIVQLARPSIPSLDGGQQQQQL
jgi:hypothetical protein